METLLLLIIGFTIVDFNQQKETDQWPTENTHAIVVEEKNVTVKSVQNTIAQTVEENR
jgi:hypothetical protein